MSDPRTDDEMNRIIAKWVGFEKQVPYETEDSDGSMINCLGGSPIPKYCSDLNAIRVAVTKLTGDDKSLWYDYLSLHLPKYPMADIHNIHQSKWTTAWFVAVEASARQRAEALVKVIEGTK